MIRYRSVTLLWAAACLAVAVASLVGERTSPRLVAAPADFWDVPESLAASADGAVYVSFWTDTIQAAVRRFSEDGATLAHWVVGAYEAGSVVAESSEGGVYVARAKTDLVRHYSRDGQQIAQWPVVSLEAAVATSPQDREDATEVYVIASTAPGSSEVRRYGPAGDLRGSFAMVGTRNDLAASSVAQPDGPDVFVAGPSIAGGSIIERRRADGNVVDVWEPDGIVAGMDVDPATNRLWVGVSQPARVIRHLQEYEADGTPGTRCELPGSPIDLTVGRRGDLYVLTYGDPALDVYREVRRYRQDCTLVDTWTLERLNGWVDPGTPSDTAEPSATGSGSATPEATETPTTAPQVSNTPTVPPSATQTTTATGTGTPWPQDWWLYLPVTWRESSLGH